MGAVFKSINQITKTDACMGTYHEPRYDSISQVLTDEIHEVSYNKVRGSIHMTNCTIVLILGRNIAAAHTIGTQTTHILTRLPLRSSAITVKGCNVLISVRNSKRIKTSTT